MQRRRHCQHRSRFFSANAVLITAHAAAPQVRRVRFRTKIPHTRRKHAAATAAAAAAAATAEATAAAPHKDTRRKYFEVSCRISYGNMCRVQVQLDADARKCCAFSWKRKLRRTPASMCWSVTASPIDVPSNCNDFANGDEDNDDEAFPEAGEREFCVQSLPMLHHYAHRRKSVLGVVVKVHEQKCRAVEEAEVCGDCASVSKSVELMNEANEFIWRVADDGDGDQNRVIVSQQQTNTATATKNGSSSSKPETPTELHEISNGIHRSSNNNNVNTTASSSEKTATTAAAARTSAQTPSPVPGAHGRKATAAVGVALLEKKSPRKLFFQKHHPRSTEAPATPTAECLDVAELQQLKLLNRHSCNGRLDYESIERHLQQTELLRQQQDKGVEALGVLLQYLVYDLDAFACPTAKHESVKAKDSLNKTLHLLDEAKNTCTELQDQLCEKEAYYVQREEELQALHRCELDKAHSNLSELKVLAKQQHAELELELAAKDSEHKRVFDSYRLEMEHKLTQRQQQLTAVEERERALEARVKACERSEQELNERLTQSEKSFEQRQQAAAEREQEQQERIKELSKELDALRATKENRERELRDKLNLSQDEISVLRCSQRSLNESTERGTSPRNTNSATSLELTRLQSEAESLRCVLELKQKEISKLTKQNEELMRDADERVTLQGKISLLESKNEMLQSEMDIKSDKEKEFLRQIDDIQKAFNHETVKRTRLTYDNEALQWQLKQRSEQLHIVEAKLQELSAQESSSLNTTTQNSSLCSINRASLSNGSSLTTIQVEDGSPPASPIVKGVIEKNDSVSWVLEMDDETPEVAASKMVKRAGSFRSVERSPLTRRQLSVSANAALAMTQTTNGAGPNPLSQSMSATSVIRPHSSEAGAEFVSRSHSRIRSKSVSVKSTDPAISAASSKSSKKLARQHSIGNARKHELMPTMWKEPMCSSSPYSGMRPRTSTMKMSSEVECAHESALFRRASASASAHKLITCDTSTLNTGERLEMRSLPTHPSVHDLKARKKCQEIQESAGEAMVSGTNSEDEGCSASSDEVVSSVSTSSVTSGSTSSLNQMKNAQMSLEEVLLLDKINSLNGTPMEVSWSDDADVFGNGSTV